MNFLAHIYLSRAFDDLCLGNFAADQVKGRQWKNFSTGIQHGILLHRQIDTFTDQHPLHQKSKARLNKKYGLYKGVIIDIFYDHFLAKNWLKYHDQDLRSYTQEFYEFLDRNKAKLPEKTLYILPYLFEHDWLYNYQFIPRLQSVFEGMNRRTKGRSRMDESIEDLLTHYDEFQSDFEAFMEKLINFSDRKRIELTQT